MYDLFSIPCPGLLPPTWSDPFQKTCQLALERSTRSCQKRVQFLAVVTVQLTAGLVLFSGGAWRVPHPAQLAAEGLDPPTAVTRCQGINGAETTGAHNTLVVGANLQAPARHNFLPVVH